MSQSPLMEPKSRPINIPEIKLSVPKSFSENLASSLKEVPKSLSENLASSLKEISDVSTNTLNIDDDLVVPTNSASGSPSKIPEKNYLIKKNEKILYEKIKKLMDEQQK